MVFKNHESFLNNYQFLDNAMSRSKDVPKGVHQSERSWVTIS